MINRHLYSIAEVQRAESNDFVEIFPFLYCHPHAILKSITTVQNSLFTVSLKTKFSKRNANFGPDLHVPYFMEPSIRINQVLKQYLVSSGIVPSSMGLPSVKNHKPHSSIEQSRGFQNSPYLV